MRLILYLFLTEYSCCFTGLCLNFIFFTPRHEIILLLPISDYLTIDRLFLVLTWVSIILEYKLWINDRCFNKDIKLTQINVLLCTHHLEKLDICFYNIGLRICNCRFLNWGADCSLPFLLDRVQHLSSTKFVNFLQSGLLTTSVYLSERLRVCYYLFI